jgi:hypothetical protein
MCAIIGSFDTTKLHELIKLNSYRGSHSYSFSLYDTYTGTLTLIKQGLGNIDLSLVEVPQRQYGVVHVQAPTTESNSINSIHPARMDLISTFQVSKDVKHEVYEKCLWHNGILKEDVVKKLQEHSGDIKWDTMLMLLELYANGWYALDKLDGSFSCLYYATNNMYLFRNEISPMFIDDKLNVSSTKFESSKATEANKVLMMNFENKTASPIFSFKTVENPYFFGDEV